MSFQSPLTFVLLFVSSSLFYFLRELIPSWYLILLSFQFVLIGLSLCVPNWRTTALAFLFLFLWNHGSQFSSQTEFPQTCQTELHNLSGKVTENPQKQSTPSTSQTKIEIKQIVLHNVEFWCGRQKYHKTRAIVKHQKKYIPWAKAGDLLQIEGAQIQASDWFTIHFTTAQRLSIKNQSQEEKFLSRSPLFYFLQTKSLHYQQEFPNALYTALLTADRYQLSKNQRQQFQDLGIAHLFAISGMHVGVLYLWGTFFFRFLTALFPFRWVKNGKARIIADLFVLGLIYGYLEIIGMPITAWRAWLMLAWWVAIRFFLPWQPPWFILSSIAALFLIQDPLTIGQLSFQLSFLSVSGILFLLPLLPLPSSKGSLLKSLGKMLLSTMLVSLWLTLISFPLISFYFGQISFGVMLNNALHINFMSWLYFPIALLTLLLTTLNFYGIPNLVEFYCYSLLNGLGKLWQILLEWNAEWNQVLIWKFEKVQWTPFQIVGYWGGLLLFLRIVLKIKQRKAMGLPLFWVSFKKESPSTGSLEEL